MAHHFYSRIALLIFILTPFSYNFSQNLDSYIYIEPLQILGITNSSIDIGYVMKGKSINNDLGIGIILPLDLWGSSMQFGTGRMDGKGFELKYTLSFNFNRNLFMGLYTGYIKHNYESSRLLDFNSEDLTNYNVQQNEISNYLILGYAESHFDGFYSVSLGIGLRSILVSNNSPVDINTLSNLYRLSDYFERESNGWHYLFGVKLSIKYGFPINEIFSKF